MIRALKQAWVIVAFIPLAVIALLFCLALFICHGPTKAGLMLDAMTQGLRAAKGAA